MGEGRPKFRIWLTMSAGWKKKSTFWNRFGSSRRNVRTNSNTEVL